MISRKQIARRPGRPTPARLVEIEREILLAAGNLFLRDGFDVVTMEKIAAAAGVSKTTLYDRYPAKDELLAAVIRDRIARWSEIAGQQDHLLTDDLRDRMLHHARTIARTSSLPEVTGFQRLIIANADRFPELARVMYEAGYVYIVNFVSRDIEMATAREGNPARDPASVASHFVSAVTGWISQEGLRGPLDEARIEEGAVRCVELFLAARAAW